MPAELATRRKYGRAGAVAFPRAARLRLSHSGTHCYTDHRRPCRGRARPDRTRRKAVAMLPLTTVDPTPAARRLPSWLKRRLPRGNGNFFTQELLRELRLETVCENARCPNRPECYARRTATFMILGNICTRPCGFCSVSKGLPEVLEDDEPARVAEAAHRLGLRHVVITSV